MNPLIEQIKKYGNLSSEMEIKLSKSIHYLAKKKGEFLLRQGQTIPIVFVIEKGLVRSFYKTNDREINLWFGFENMMLGSITTLYFNKPSIENIQFLEDTNLFYLSNEDLDQFYNTYNEANIIGRKIAEEYCKILEERSFSLQTKSAFERYEELVYKQPEILERVSLGNIASYLGITKETLSRVRTK